VYSMNRTGPRTDPWGTPQMRSMTDEHEVPIRTYCDRPSRYDLNHLWATSHAKCIADYNVVFQQESAPDELQVVRLNKSSQRLVEVWQCINIAFE